MTKRRVQTLLVAMLVLLSLAPFVRMISRAGPPASERADTALAHVELTTGSARAGAKLPMIVAIHGLGDTPEHFVELFRALDLPARVIAPRAPDPWHEGTSWYPVDDPVRKPAVIEERARRVVRLIDELSQKRPTSGRPIVTGFSQGGVLSFQIASRHPDRIGGALPIAGALPGSLLREPIGRAELRVYAFHGKDDERVPFADAERTVRALERAGTRASLAGYAGVGHHISDDMLAAYLAAVRELVELTTR